MQPRPAPVLFLCLFAAQSAFMVLAPILPQVAADLGVSTAAAGQLRAASGVAGGVTALLVGRLARRAGVRDLLLAGLGLLAAGSLASAAAPSFAALAAAQVAVGAGVAIVLASGVAAAADWAAPERRNKVLAWALLGQPAAWVAGMPLAGAVATADWRLSWVTVPFAAAVIALIAVARRPRVARGAAGPPAGREVWRRPRVAAWAAGELCAYGAWAGTLVFAGSLLIEVHGASVATAGMLLGAAAIAYFPAVFAAQRRLDADARGLLVALALTGAASVAVFAVVRPALWFSVAAFAVAVAIAGARTIAGSAFGLNAAPDLRVAVMGIRAAATQFGYLLGTALGGVALATGGYDALGVVLAALYVGAALPHLASSGPLHRLVAARPGRGRDQDARRPGAVVAHRP